VLFVVATGGCGINQPAVPPTAAARMAAKISFGFINFSFISFRRLCAAKNLRTNHGHKTSVEQKGKVALRRLKAHHRRSSGMNQRRRAQFRAKSVAPDANEDGVIVKLMKSAGFSGKVQIKTAGARSESWS